MKMLENWEVFGLLKKRIQKNYTNESAIMKREQKKKHIKNVASHQRKMNLKRKFSIQKRLFPFRSCQFK